VYYCVGVTDEERARPQRLLVTVDMSFDFTVAAVSDRVTKTIDYSVVAQMLLKYGEGRSWKLLEKLSANIAESILIQFHPQAVSVEVKKFSIPQARHVSVTWVQKRG
jgi:FolB domain-containing protein